jgi:glycosyltransferase involved in cell wall biosynthesis
VSTVLAVVQTHPIQYHAPVFRAVQQTYGIPVTAIYGSDFSVAGYHDQQFGATFSWDTDLLSGYSSMFLSRTREGGAADFSAVTARGLWRALRRVNPAAVLVGGYSPQFHRTALIQASLLGRPVLIRAETSDEEPASAPRRLGRRMLLRSLYAGVSKFLYIGARSRRHYEQLGCRTESLLFSPYCVDSSPFAPDESARTRLRDQARAALGIGDAELVLLFSGKLISKKRPDLLVEAVPLVQRETSRPITLLFLGDGELHEPLRARVAAASGIRAQFLGFRNQRELSPYYHAADLLVLPSDHAETWGLVVNEAMTHGLPAVVSSRVGCAEDLVDQGKTGERFEQFTAEALANAVARAVPLVGDATVRQQCRARAMAYSVDAAASGIAAAYRSCVPAL